MLLLLGGLLGVAECLGCGSTLASGLPHLLTRSLGDTITLSRDVVI